MEGIDVQVTGAMTQTVEYADQAGSIALLDEELQMLEGSLNDLEKRIGSVMSQYATSEKLSEPKPEPASQLRGRVERLAHLRRTLNEIISRVDL